MHKKYIRDKVLTFHLTLLEGQNKVGDDSTTEVKGQGVTRGPPVGGQNFKMGIFLFWKQIWILLKKVAEESTFLFLIFLLQVGQKGGQRS